jgi:hypothetical protein
MKKTLFLLLALTSGSLFTHAQRIGSTPEYVKALTSQWKGERTADGRPKVSDLVLERLQHCTWLVRKATEIRLLKIGKFLNQDKLWLDGL